MAIKRSSKVDASFSPSSMTDLMFLLLTFFIVLTTLISPNALKLVLPRSNSQAAEKAYTSVSITGNLNYYVEMTPVPFSQLEEALRQRLAGTENPTVSLHCDRTVPVDEVVKVMNIARNNDYKLILATSPE